MTELRFVGRWCSPKSDTRKLSKYRFVSDSSGEYIEFEVGNAIAKCDTSKEHLLLKYSWHLHLGFVKSTFREKGVPKSLLFKHAVLNITKSHTRIDVKDGDQLNCRENNLIVVVQERDDRLDYIEASSQTSFDLEIVKRGRWMGGKPGGNITEREYSYSVRFTKPTLTKAFAYSSYASKEECKIAAERFRCEESDRRGILRNKMRMVQNKDGKLYLEVTLNNAQIMICDVDDKDKVEKVVWSVKQSYNTFYAEHSSRKGLDLKPERFHRLIVDYEVVDHINGNGLDNRKCNLREGNRATNVRNAQKRKDNKSGITGVTFTKGAWVVQWPENGKRMSKRFGIAYGSLERAKKLAIEFRKTKDRELNLHPRQ